jgi:hypothetical protein
VQLSSSADRGDSPHTLEVVETEPAAASVCGVAAAAAAVAASCGAGLLLWRSCDSVYAIAVEVQ